MPPRGSAGKRTSSVKPTKQIKALAATMAAGADHLVREQHGEPDLSNPPEIRGELDLASYNLSTKQKLAALALARTYKSNVAICRELHVGHTTLMQWKKDPLFLQLVTEAQNRLANEPMFAIQPLVPRALGRYEEALNTKDKDNLGIAVRVAQDVLDRAYGKPVIRQQVAEMKEVHIHIHDDTSVDSKKYIQVDE